jgi:hypothetical protein
MLSNDIGSRQFRPFGKKAPKRPCDAGLLGPTLVAELQCRVAVLCNLGYLTVRIVPLSACVLNASDAFPPARSQE